MCVLLHLSVKREHVCPRGLLLSWGDLACTQFGSILDRFALVNKNQVPGYQLTVKFGP